MYKIMFVVGLIASFILPTVALAAANVNSVTLNGASYVQVNPGDNIIASVTGTLTNGTKWKGTGWGLNNSGTVPTCTNTKNAKDGTRNNDTGVFTETFIIKAPATPGLYNANFVLDEANKCGNPLTGVTTLAYAVRVGTNTVPPVIAAHSDVTVQLVSPASGSVATYSSPTAADHFGNPVAVSCSPASGTFFNLGNTLVLCSAHDSWGNNAVPLFFTVSVLPPPDSVPPVIAAHADVYAEATSSAGIVVNYTLPVATDNIDGTVPVSCIQPPGSIFMSGTNVVTCNAQDAAGNHAAATLFNVVVTVVSPPPHPLTPFIMASQPDESYMCLPDESNGWRACYTGGTSSFVLPLGQGSTFATGALKSVTVAIDPTFAAQYQANTPWTVSFNCFTDANYTIPCTNWVQSNAHNGHVNDFIFETAATTTDNKHWIADFSTSAVNYDGSSPVVFKSAYFYRMTINDSGIGWPAFGQTPVVGSPTAAQPYWVITGLH